MQILDFFSSFWSSSSLDPHTGQYFASPSIFSPQNGQSILIIGFVETGCVYCTICLNGALKFPTLISIGIVERILPLDESVAVKLKTPSALGSIENNRLFL